MAEIQENVIEWISGDNEIACTFTQRKWINRVKKWKTENGDVSVFVENPDGSVFCHLPIGYLKLSPKRTVEMSDEQRDALRERLAAARSGKGETDDG